MNSPDAGISVKAPPTSSWRLPAWPVATGVTAAAMLAGLYVAVVGLVQGIDHALELIAGDFYYVVPIVVGFGTQMGLLVYSRGLHLHQGTRATKLLGGAGTGTSTVSMVACCAHHLTAALPFIGLSGAAIFLNDYRGPLMALGIVSNAAGILITVRGIRRARQCRSPSVALSPSPAG